MRIQTLLLLATVTLFTLPLTGASDALATSATTSTSSLGLGSVGMSSIAATKYSHGDCVGPGLPGTAPVHATHTTNVPGFTGTSAINFNLAALNIPGSPGPCPVTAASAGVLPQDFTGTYHLTAVCRGNVNPGTTFLDWNIGFVAGALIVTQGSAGNLCYVASGGTMSLDVTIAISSVTFEGQTLPPTGGILLTISQ